MRLIDADELKKKAKMIDWLCNKQVVSVEDIDNTPTVEQKHYERIVAQINPVIDERPHGEWLLLRTNYEDSGNNFYECTNCHYSDIHADSAEVPYCWHCGAEMKGGAE